MYICIYIICGDKETWLKYVVLCLVVQSCRHVWLFVSDIYIHNIYTESNSAGKESAAMQETWVRSLGWEDPLSIERPPTPVFCLENSLDGIDHGFAKSWTWLSDFHFHVYHIFLIHTCWVTFRFLLCLNYCK